MENKKIAVFDACGTITKTNNTLDFIRYVLKKDNKLKYIIFKLLLLLSLFINAFKINKLLKKDMIRKRIIKLLNGFSIRLIEERAKEYIDKVENGHLNHEIIALIKKEKESKHEVMIISASINPPIKELAKRLDVKYISSEMEEVDGFYTGKLKTDLLGKKEIAIDLNKYDLNNSSIYSDNLDDEDFMINFREIYPIIYGSNQNLWNLKGEHVNFIHFKKDESKNEDVNSINENTINRVYIPTMYYVISRFHLSGLVVLFLKEIIPFIFAIYLFTNEGIKTFIIMPLSFIIFYSVYEIGGLFNDLLANKEKEGNPTLRIKEGIKINSVLFILIRFLFIFVALLFLNNYGYNQTFYIGALLLCLITYILHTLIKNNIRLITFILLKIFRNLIPLLIFINIANYNILINIFLAFLLVNSPLRIYKYFSKRTNLKKLDFFENKIKFYIFITFFSLIIYILFSNHIYLIISIYFLILSIITRLAD